MQIVASARDGYAILWKENGEHYLFCKARHYPDVPTWIAEENVRNCIHELGMVRQNNHLRSGDMLPALREEKVTKPNIVLPVLQSAY